jgi:hypothetical protein
VKIGGKVRFRSNGSSLPQIATPMFGYKSDIGIDQRFGFIDTDAVTAADCDGRQLRRVSIGDPWRPPSKVIGQTCSRRVAVQAAGSFVRLHPVCGEEIR